MTNYRRYRFEGGSYFFTLTLVKRRSTLLVDNIDLLTTAFRAVRQAHPFQTQAMVVLPDHLHCIWTLPDGDDDFPTRWRQIKSAFSRALPAGEMVSDSRRKQGERGIWQRRYWEHAVRGETEMQRIVDYIHYNPVRHGHVSHPVAWPYSTLHRYVAQGLLSPDWAGAAVGGDEDFCCGEPMGD